MNILWPKEIQWQTCNLMKTYFDLTQAVCVFGKRKRILDLRYRTTGSLSKKSRGLFNKNPREGVSSKTGR